MFKDSLLKSKQYLVQIFFFTKWIHSFILKFFISIFIVRFILCEINIAKLLNHEHLGISEFVRYKEIETYKLYVLDIEEVSVIEGLLQYSRF